MNMSVLKKKRGDEGEEKKCVCRASYLPETTEQTSKIQKYVDSFFLSIINIYCFLFETKVEKHPFK
jgi:hypothetical protein